jgi:GMP synthase (glutamine-hydrolysing)
VTLNRKPSNKALAWRHGIDGAVLDKDIRVKEIGNWIAHQVMPTRSRRGRG